MKKNNLDHSDLVFLTFLDKMCVHFAYWAIITLVYVLCSKQPMNRMTFKYYRALKATLDMLTNKCSKGILMYGINTIEQTSFCKLIDLRKAAKRLLSCTSIEIRGIGHYLAAEKAFAAWLQANVTLPGNPRWGYLSSPHNWFRNNFAEDLNILKLSIAHTEYFLILREEHLLYIRKLLFSPHQHG